jgi:hypothetical protein
MEVHYDPAYERSRRKDDRASLGVIGLAALAPADQDAAAARIAELIQGREEIP